MPPLSPIRASLFASAFGDSLGLPTEFMRSTDSIIKSFPPDGPRTLTGNPALVTDDTQMMLAVARAIIACPAPLQPAPLTAALRKSFIDWSISPDNYRSPGMTCMTACYNLKTDPHRPWQSATVAGSKGCGANMRVQPVGLLSTRFLSDGETSRAGIAQLQAALTHGHPTGLAASDLTAQAIAALIAGIAPKDLVDHLQTYARRQRMVYHSAWLGNLWQASADSFPQSFISRGWDECLTILQRLQVAAARQDRDLDPCLSTGEGWIAEEALATGLLCFLLYPNDPIEALRRAAVTSGDSDSIACLTGAFAGAYLGDAAFPAEWFEQIEYAAQLNQVAVALSQ